MFVLYISRRKFFFSRANDPNTLFFTKIGIETGSKKKNSKKTEDHLRMLCYIMIVSTVTPVNARLMSQRLHEREHK